MLWTQRTNPKLFCLDSCWFFFFLQLALFSYWLCKAFVRKEKLLRSCISKRFLKLSIKWSDWSIFKLLHFCTSFCRLYSFMFCLDKVKHEDRTPVMTDIFHRVLISLSARWSFFQFESPHPTDYSIKDCIDKSRIGFQRNCDVIRF